MRQNSYGSNSRPPPPMSSAAGTPAAGAPVSRPDARVPGRDDALWCWAFPPPPPRFIRNTRVRKMAGKGFPGVGLVCFGCVRRQNITRESVPEPDLPTHGQKGLNGNLRRSQWTWVFPRHLTRSPWASAISVDTLDSRPLGRLARARPRYLYITIRARPKNFHRSDYLLRDSPKKF